MFDVNEYEKPVKGAGLSDEAKGLIAEAIKQIDLIEGADEDFGPAQIGHEPYRNLETLLERLEAKTELLGPEDCAGLIMGLAKRQNAQAANYAILAELYRRQRSEGTIAVQSRDKVAWPSA